MTTNIVEKKRLSINKLRNLIKSNYFRGVEEVQGTFMKTLLVKVLEEKIDEMPEYIEILSNTSKNNLELVMDDYQNMCQAILRDCYKIFKTKPEFFIENAAKPLNIKQHSITPELYKEDDELFETEFICPECKNKQYAHFYKNSNGKDSFISCCLTIEHTEKAINLKKDKDEESKTIFKIGKFSSQDLGNTISPMYITTQESAIKKNPKASYNLKVTRDIAENEWTSALTKSITANVSGNLCSFLDKLYNVINEHIKTHKQNVVLLEKHKNIAIENNISFLQFELSANFTNKEEIETYNKKISLYNMWLNETFYQQNDIKKEDAPCLKKLKGFPSFPLVEELSLSNIDRSTLLGQVFEILENHKNKSDNFWKNLDKETFNTIIDNYKPYRDKKNKPKKAIEQVSYIFEFYFKQNENIEQAYNKAVLYIDKKINTILKHLDNNLDSKDRRSQIALLEWLIAKSRLMFEYLRLNDFPKFADERIRFDLLCSTIKGIGFKMEHSNKVLDIQGFSLDSNENFKYGTSIAYKLLPDNNKQYFLVLNFSKGSNIRIAKGNNINSEFYGYGSKNEGKEGSFYPLNINRNDDGLILLPLAFGKRQGREYLWNFDYKIEENGQKINNARIIKKKVYDKAQDQYKYEYYVAITFTKLKAMPFSSFDQKYQAILGIDRGEKVPAAATIIDLNGKILETRILGQDHYKKQLEIQRKKEFEQSQTGKYRDILSNKAKNLADSMVKQIGVEIIELAIKHKALIVFEDLSRGFGRGGKNTYMSQKQYTKLEDFITTKLKYEGLINSRQDVLTNTRNGIIAKVTAQYTSKTCSNCGTVFTSKDSDFYFANLKKKENGFITLNKANKEVYLDINYSYYSKKQNKAVNTNANKELEEIIGNKDISNLNKTEQKSIKSILSSALNPRKDQEHFECLICGHKANADEQASLNIARIWMFVKGEEIESLKNNSFDTKKSYKGSVEKKRYDKDKTKYPYPIAITDYFKRKLSEEWKKTN